MPILLYFFSCLACVFSQSLFAHTAAESPLLTEADIQNVMADIFKQHVDKKELNGTLFKLASEHYVEQFDGDHIYLLEQEALPFMKLNDRSASELNDQYQNKNFIFFDSLNKLFEQSVLRAQKIRRAQKQNYSKWIREVIEGGGYQESWSDWARSVDDLKKRQESYFKAFVGASVHRLGKARILEKQSEVISQFEESQLALENPYLYLSVRGSPISADQKHNLFSLRILKALASSLDSHTKIYNPKEASEVKTRLEKGSEVKVSSEQFGNGIIGVIKLDSFFQSPGGNNSELAVKNAIQKLDKENLRGLVLDLRDNFGGFLNQAVKVAGLFITNGVVVISKYSSGEERFYRDMDGKAAFKGPLVILVSKMTASAAEIVAGALQDYGVALIVGDDHTYGKGTIQSQTVTGDTKEAASYFKVTVGMYYTPSGATPQIQGVKSDVVVPGIRENQRIGEAYLEGALKQDTIPSVIDDKLTDVEKDEKEWYVKYYLASLQKQKFEIKNILPQLKDKSAYRIKYNLEYQDFLKDPGNPIYEKKDPQLKEAIEIVKDIIYIETKTRHK